MNKEVYLEAVDFEKWRIKKSEKEIKCLKKQYLKEKEVV